MEEAKFSTISKENIWCTLKLKDNDILLLGCIYRSPSTNNDNTQRLCNLLQEVDEINLSHLLIVGDFNFPEVDYSKYHSNAPQNHRSHIFINKILDIFLYQPITEIMKILMKI